MNKGTKHERNLNHLKNNNQQVAAILDTAVVVKKFVRRLHKMK